jgi:shikimate dehydrogenase
MAKMVATDGYDDEYTSRILAILINAGAITQSQADEARAAFEARLAEDPNADIAQVIVELGFASDNLVVRAKAKYSNLQFFDFDKHKVEIEAIKLIPIEIIRAHRVLPVVVKSDKLYVAIHSPKTSLDALYAIRAIVKNKGLSPQPVLAIRSKLEEAIDYWSTTRSNDSMPEAKKEFHLTGSTRVVSVWGHPVAHSRSPKMQNAAIQALGLDWIYVPCDVAPENLPEAVAGIRAMGFVGTNCTVPLKEQVGQYLDEINPDAKLAGSVNTVVNRDGRLYGYSTDGPGLIWDLERQGVAVADGLKVLIWGAGGSGRAIAHALAKARCDVTIANRTVERAQQLADAVGGGTKAVGLEGEDYEMALQSADLLINTTTLGMHGDGIPPIPNGTFRAGQTVYDIVYTPSETPLLKVARSSGCRSMNGLGMLACQGALSLSLWTGMDPKEMPLAIMLESLGIEEGS